MVQNRASRRDNRETMDEGQIQPPRPPRAPRAPQGPLGGLGPQGYPLGTHGDPPGSPRATPGPPGHPPGPPHQFSILFSTFFDQIRENSGPGPKMSTFFMKTKVVDLKKLCRTHLLINSGDHFLTISWGSKFPSIWGLAWGALPWLGWLACCALPRLGLPCLDLL